MAELSCAERVSLESILRANDTKIVFTQPGPKAEVGNASREGNQDRPKVVRHGRYITLQLAEVAIPRNLFSNILRLIGGLRLAPLPQ